MDDNIHMEPCGVNSCFIGNAKTTCLVKNGSLNVDGDSAQRKTWCPSHILDFSNLSIGWCLFIILFLPFSKLQNMISIIKFEFQTLLYNMDPDPLIMALLPCVYDLDIEYTRKHSVPGVESVCCLKQYQIV